MVALGAAPFAGLHAAHVAFENVAQWPIFCTAKGTIGFTGKQNRTSPGTSPSHRHTRVICLVSAINMFEYHSCDGHKASMLSTTKEHRDATQEFQIT